MDTRNPFLVLGLNPSALKGLKDSQIATLLKGIYRTQMLLHHEDVGGSKARSRDLNWAMDQLDQGSNRESFDDWKERFLRPRKDQLADAVGEKSRADKNLSDAQDKLDEIWSSFCNGGSSHIGTPYLPDMKIVLAPTGEDYFRRMASGGIDRGDEFVSQAERRSLLTVSQKGCLLEQFNLTRCKVTKGSPVPNHVTKESCFLNSAGYGYYLDKTASTKQVLEDTRIIGSIAANMIVRGESKSTRVLESLICGNPTKETYSFLKEGFPWEVFKPWALKVIPDVIKKEHLVAVRGNRGEGAYIILGQIIGFTVAG